MTSDPVRTMGPAPFASMEDIVRPWVRILTTRVLREPSGPEEEFPDAFIEWGGPTDFKFDDDFRDRSPGIPPGEEPLPPGPVELYEEARTWSDFEVVNPENNDQKLILRKINAIAFDEPDSAYHSKSGFPVRGRQWLLSFQNGYTAEDIPDYLRNKADVPFEPAVFDPLTHIKEINWGGNFIIIAFATTGGVSGNPGIFMVHPQDPSFLDNWSNDGHGFPGPPAPADFKHWYFKNVFVGSLGNADAQCVMLYINISKINAAYQQELFDEGRPAFEFTFPFYNPNITQPTQATTGKARAIVYKAASKKLLDNFEITGEGLPDHPTLTRVLDEMNIPDGEVAVDHYGNPLVIDLDYSIPPIPPSSGGPNFHIEPIRFLWDYLSVGALPRLETTI